MIPASCFVSRFTRVLGAAVLLIRPFIFRRKTLGEPLAGVVGALGSEAVAKVSDVVSLRGIRCKLQC